MTSPSWLALETSTDTLSIAVARGAHTWRYNGAGAAQSSPSMIPQSLALLAEADLKVADLQAVVFGRGPGAFTGLRTSCAVAQGLAYGAGVKVLPIDTLLAVAEEARLVQAEAKPTQVDAQGQALAATPTQRVLAVMDARMEQVYVAAYEFTPHNANQADAHAQPSASLPGTWQCVQAPTLQSPETLTWPEAWQGQTFVVAGNAHAVYGTRWPAGLSAEHIAALPTATALLRLAPQAWAHGDAVPPEEALPLYVRDKVAQTTAERMQAKAAAPASA
jgi:tRNA threonylcarbamoyladenosine biosynthesis protein TsaB